METSSPCPSRRGLEALEDDAQGFSLRTTNVNGSAGRAYHYSIGIVKQAYLYVQYETCWGVDMRAPRA